jgi:hypothetical protein
VLARLAWSICGEVFKWSFRPRSLMELSEGSWQGALTEKINTPSIPNYKTFKNLGESKHLKFDQNYRENYKNL